ncbi:hypothetical protein BC828DRAFT_391388 [Blastocladiella britannica]|nr:hypothetical protein BC828DRAFT_391388 [Blastocladiella britannica]
MLSLIERVQKHLRPAEAILREEVDKNPFYPFNRVSPTRFRLSVRYRRLYAAVAFLLVSLAVLIGWIATQSVSNNSYFLFPLFTTVISIAALLNYRSKRVYILDHETLQYSFAYDDTVYTKGHFHNAYIRLRRETRSGAVGPVRLKYYYLVFNGFQMDVLRISGTTSNVNELRRLGQIMANNLNINYFDENNSSEHHTVRHLRPMAIKASPATAAGVGRGVSHVSGFFAGRKASIV